MKRLLLVTLLVIFLALLVTGPVLAHEGEHCASGRDFGQHVAAHARAGHLGADHNPGMHRGFSHCL